MSNEFRVTNPDEQTKKWADLKRTKDATDDGEDVSPMWLGFIACFVGMVIGAGIVHMLHMALRP